MIMKKDNKKTVTKVQRNNKELLVNQFVNVSYTRNRKDVGTLRQSIERAESVYTPNRAALYNLYHDLVTIDGHLSGILEKRTKAVTGKQMIFVDKSGKQIDAFNALIESTKFERLKEVLMESIYWGTSAVEFIVGKEFDFEEIDKRHIRPEKKQIALSQFEIEGIDIATLPFCWMIGRKNDLGKLLQCSMYAIYKRSGYGDFAQYVEIFGQPVRIIYYDAYDKQTENELRKTLEDSGGSLVMMIPKQANFEMLDGKTSNGTGELQERLISACNREMSIAILGNTETTSSSSSSGYAQAEVHSEQQKELTRSDMRYVLNLLNSEYFLNILASYGFPIDGGHFQYVEEKDIEKLSKRLSIDLQLSTKVPIADDYWYETYGLPKPDNYEELKREEAERREAIQRQLEQPKEDDKKKKGLMAFFEKAPKN